MKKTIKYIFTLIVSSMLFAACDNYGDQFVASPGGYDQEALQDTNFVIALKSGVSPMVIQSSQLAGNVALFTCTSTPTLADTSASVVYQLQISDVAAFTTHKNVASTFSGVAGSDISVSYMTLNDSIKSYNNTSAQRAVYARLIAYITVGGTKAAFKSKLLNMMVTPYNYPPVAVNDVATTIVGSSVSVSVLSNDTDTESHTLTVTGATTPAHGTVVVNANGTITYSPASDYSGSDSFTYTISDGNGGTATGTVGVTVNAVGPYYSVTPKPYYIIGLANGAWNNSMAGLGVSIYPLSLVSGDKYDPSGAGEYTFTGYFQATKGFKLIRDIGSWDEQWGSSDGTVNTLVHNNGSSKDIKVPADGYYTITLNSISNSMSIVPASVSPTSYTSMGMIGDINSWASDVVMSPSETTNNHVWYTTYTFTGDATDGVKFRANGEWTVNWGNENFPNGLATQGGGNVKYKAGTYTVVFNDISGCYYFVKH